jgi:hypothetical protein
MLQFRKPDGCEGTVFLAPDPDGVDHLYAIVKATFDIRGDGLRLSEDQVPVTYEPEYHGDPETSSVRTPSDISLMKPATDVVLIGHAYPPGGRPALWTDTSLTVGHLAQHVRVFGDRVWENAAVGYSASAPKPFTAMPLVWERAYGGVDMAAGEPVAESRNPAGVGFHHRRGESTIAGTPLPNLEDPRNPISAWNDTRTPVGYGAVAAHWEPRRSFAGTYDAEWEKNRAPVLPADFDARFFNVAAPSLISSGYLRGDEAVETTGMTTNGTMRFALPGWGFDVTCLIDDVPSVAMAALDTVIVEPDVPRAVLVWRTAFECDKRALRISHVSAARRPAR